MKVETAELRFIRDDQGVRWFATMRSDRTLPLSPRDIHERLIRDGRIKPDLLEIAKKGVLRAMREYQGNYCTPVMLVEEIDKIFDSLAIDIEKGE